MLKLLHNCTHVTHWQNTSHRREARHAKKPPGFSNLMTLETARFPDPCLVFFPSSKRKPLPSTGKCEQLLTLAVLATTQAQKKERTCSGIFFFPVLGHGPRLPQCYHEETVGACPWRALPTKAGGFHSWLETNTASLEIQLDPLKNGPHLTSITQMQRELTNYSL